ncbi:hypothetical protein LBMAG42_51960 [Deltaproteobacteria bacterium]|nr:hypothetical protein LBMAG42_51960 [Deltaproteobacteria bacterium]
MSDFDQSIGGVAVAVAAEAAFRARREAAEQNHALANQFGSMDAALEIGRRGGVVAVHKGRDVWDRGADRLSPVVGGFLATIAVIGAGTLIIKAVKTMRASP